jgi:hypothetical protein
MATANFTIRAEDGWTAVTSDPVTFIRIRSNTPNHAFFVTTGSSAPAASVIGFKQQCDEFWCDVPVADNFYVRCAENLPQGTRIDVFYIEDVSP